MIAFPILSECLLKRPGLSLNYFNKHNEDTMNKITLIGAALLGLLSAPSFAEEHADRALEQTKLAIQYGTAEHNPILVKHAKEALAHAKMSAALANGESKEHMDAAIKSLEAAIDHGKMKGKQHVKIATKAAQAAAEHIKAGNQ
jgi:hypothetical protein